MKIKDSNCAGILSDQEEAATASDLYEYNYNPGYCHGNTFVKSGSLVKNGQNQ